MKKIKVAEVITRLDWGGSPDIVRIILQGLNPDIYESKLIFGLTKNPSKKTSDFLRDFKKNVVVIPELKREVSPFTDLMALIKLYFLFRRERFDIVHTHTAKAGVLGRLAAYLARVPAIIHTPHGHNFYGYFPQVMSKVIILIERFIGCFTDKIIALTELERKDLLRFKVVGQERIILIPQGIDLKLNGDMAKKRDEIRKEFNIKPEDLLVGMVGRLEPVKGPGYFVEAAKDVARDFSNVRFLLAGEGSLHKKLIRQTQRLGLTEKFIFTGWRQDALDIIRALDILVLPSLNEAVGIVLIEAGVFSVPVVATRVGGIPEIVQDNQTGILVNPKDARGLSAAIKLLLKDETKRRQMGLAAQAWIKGRFSAEEMIKNIQGLYTDVSKGL